MGARLGGSWSDECHQLIRRLVALGAPHPQADAGTLGHRAPMGGVRHSPGRGLGSPAQPAGIEAGPTLAEVSKNVRKKGKNVNGNGAQKTQWFEKRNQLNIVFDNS